MKNSEKKRIALFGEVLADLFPQETVLGGAPYNVACHLQAFGLYPLMISRTGEDALGEQLLNAMARLGIDTRGIQQDDVYPTGQVKVHFEHSDHHFEILANQAYDHIDPGMALTAIIRAEPTLLYFGTLAQRSKPSSLAIDQILDAHDGLKFLDINLRNPWYNKSTIRHSMQRADIVKMNEEELDIVAHFFRINDDKPEEKARALLTMFGLEQILITCGEQGAWLLDTSGEFFRTGPARAAAGLVDTVGAGDAFAAVFIIGLLNEWPLALTLERANDFATALCSIRGGVPAEHHFYAPFIKKWLK